nr:hypothetical protein [Tanacetum cinerariifolium]
FSDVISSGKPTPYYDPIVSTISLILTPFGNSDFLLEEVDAFLALEDDPTSPEVDQSYELKICKAKTDKSSINEPLEVKLKDLPPHLEYAFLEGGDKLTVIIANDLSVEEKTALITVLKSYKRAIAWKLFDIKVVVLTSQQRHLFSSAGETLFTISGNFFWQWKVFTGSGNALCVYFQQSFPKLDDPATIKFPE